MVKSAIIRFGFSEWRNRKRKTFNGYTLLVPVPGDLPVFTQIALNIIGQQNSKSLNEILVIPDFPSNEFREVFFGILKKTQHANISRLVEMNRFQQLIGRLSGSGNLFHFLQLINGIENSSSSYLIFHDADLFLPPGDFLFKRFELCSSKNLSVLGMDPRKKRYTEGCQHFVATWEMVACYEWIYRFKPYQLRGMQQLNVNGKNITFDTTHLMQFLSDRKEIQHEKISSDFVHFNYVITTYRRFLKAPKPYEDRWFKLLLIRLLVDSFESIGWKYQELPTLNEFEAALNGEKFESKLSCYSSESKAYYPIFRGNIDRLLNLGCFEKKTIVRMNDKIKPFDRYLI